MIYGVAQFLPPESFDDPHRGLDKDSLPSKLAEKFAGIVPKVRSVSDWPKVHDALCRGSEIVIELRSPTLRKAVLRFLTGGQNDGSYEIHYQTPSRIDKGKVIKVWAIAEDAPEESVSMLKPFAHRYVVQTASDDRSKTHLMWCVGINECRKFVME